MAHEIPADPRVDGEEALARCDWTEAKQHFERALAEAPGDPRALDGLCLALFWLGNARAAREARERAYVEHRRRGDTCLAASAALYIASDYRAFEGNEAAWAGWLARAERCLEDVHLCSEHGTIEIERAKRAAEPDVAEAHARRALQIARELRDPDLEVSGLSQLGVALVESGRWEEGMSLLDEAMAAAMGGEASDARAIGDACCQTLVACDQIADLKRASEWCRVVVDFTERRRFTPVYAWCRAIYAGVLITTGEWERAERELVDSLRMYETVGGVGTRVLALARLAELRLRQGRLEEAERLLGGCEEHPAALAQVARLRLVRGDANTAAAIVERRLEALADEAPARAPLLPLLVGAQLARGDLEAAAAAAERLQRLADVLRRENLRALADLAASEVAIAGGGNARARLESALELFVRLGMPFEEGETRLALARVFATAHPALAIEEARHALTVFERLGAARKADEAAALLRARGASGRTAARRAGELTSRERDVLCLLREGLSNSEIARRLVISEKTAGHHVGAIFRKVGVRNRAEAAAYALREAERRDDAP
ncbi:MAG: LuxR C-terminal-related transcriptional regulator [Actinomycetota bacterium]|nr:LuxR C-terminal-related transcriptional regulator [Actinomycetota bacterium]